jgi:hypothetical protein
VERYKEDGEAVITLPEGLNPVPRGTYEAVDGSMAVTARDLIYVLRLWHMVEDES